MFWEMQCFLKVSSILGSGRARGRPSLVAQRAWGEGARAKPGPQLAALGARPCSARPHLPPPAGWSGGGGGSPQPTITVGGGTAGLGEPAGQVPGVRVCQGPPPSPSQGPVLSAQPVLVQQDPGPLRKQRPPDPCAAGCPVAPAPQVGAGPGPGCGGGPGQEGGIPPPAGMPQAGLHSVGKLLLSALPQGECNRVLGGGCCCGGTPSPHPDSALTGHRHSCR